MRYVALKRLTYVGQDGATYAVLPGEAVPEFDSWGSAVRHAHIHSHSVVDTEVLNPNIVDGVIRMTVYGRTTEPTVGKAAAQAVDEVATIEAHKCPHCDHPGFAVKNSLAQHIKRKH